jgi:hypothetical protein
MRIKLNSVELSISKAYTNPQYKSKRVLTTALFSYVELWLLNQSKEKTYYARFFWKQAANFYKAANELPIESKPLIAYYCCMNAAKALISLRDNNDPLINISHGVSSSRSTRQSILDKEIILKGGGVLARLAKCINDCDQKDQFKVLDLLRNLPSIHRTFCITCSKKTELFIPIHDICFESNKGSKKSCIQFSVDPAYSNGNSLKNVSSSFERTNDVESVIYRTRKRFDWDIHKKESVRIGNLVTYHNTIRHKFFYIKGHSVSWYIKKENVKGVIQRSPLVITYALMHWLSELVRYDPKEFNQLLSGHYNWLICEFLDLCFQQFIDEISCEITGENIGYGKGM